MGVSGADAALGRGAPGRVMAMMAMIARAMARARILSIVFWGFFVCGGVVVRKEDVGWGVLFSGAADAAVDVGDGGV